MDPLTHTLVGASLAETRLRRATPLAAATLIIGANLPDVDVFTYILGGDTALGFRRGWTHGVLAMVALPLLLTGTMLLCDRRVRRRRRGAAPPARFWPVLGLASVSVLSHPALDWLNTYGIRLLMPFDGRWFYGDSLFIIDPWLWLLAASAVVLAHTRSPLSIAAWTVLGAAVTALVTGVNLAPAPAKITWCLWLTTIVGVRAWGVVQDRLPRVATVCLITTLVYIGVMIVGTRVTQRQAASWLAGQGIVPAHIMAGPVVANPFVRDVIVVGTDHYYFLEIAWLADETFQVAGPSVPIGEPGPIVEAALAAPHVQGLRTWMRFPSYEVEDLADGYRVTIRDVRFSRVTATGIGTAVVELDRDLNLRGAD